MTTSLYLASAESGSGKSAVALGLLDQLTRHGGRVGVFRPIVVSADEDPLLELLLPRSSSLLDASASTGVTYERVHAGADAALAAIVDRFHAVADQHDTVLVVGSDYTDVPGPTEFSVNASVAANIGSLMLLVVPAVNRTPAEVATAAELTAHEARMRHAQVGAVIANRVDPHHLAGTSQALATQFAGTPTYALPDDPVLKAPTVRDLMAACGGSLLLVTRSCWTGRPCRCSWPV